MFKFLEGSVLPDHYQLFRLRQSCSAVPIGLVSAYRENGGEKIHLLIETISLPSKHPSEYQELVSNQVASKQ